MSLGDVIALVTTVSHAVFLLSRRAVAALSELAVQVSSTASAANMLPPCPFAPTLMAIDGTGGLVAVEGAPASNEKPNSSATVGGGAES